MTKYLLIAALFYVISVANTDDTRCANNASSTMSDCTQADIIITLLDNAKNLLEDAKRYAALKTSQVSETPLRSLGDPPGNRDPTVENYCSMPIDCAAILDSNSAAQSGIYRIWPRNRAIEEFFDVYCDMDDDGGAWTVIQRRGDFDSGTEYFYQNWDAYKRGFGDLNKDFWLGNDKIHAVTSQRLNTVKFVLSDFEGNTTYATYDDFWIEDEIRNYTLHVKGYRGTAGDAFALYHDGSQFSTKDRNNSGYSRPCATEFSGAWWFKNCHYSHLNGLYLKGIHNSSFHGVMWYYFRHDKYSLKDSVIKIRPRDYKGKVLRMSHHIRLFPHLPMI